MKPAELREEIAVELEALEAIVNELLVLQEDVAEREPTVREKTAAVAFLAQFYNGKVLSRIKTSLSNYLQTIGTEELLKPNNWALVDDDMGG